MKIGQYLFLIFFILLCSFTARAEDELTRSRYTIISAYIYNFTQFTTWPQDSIKDNFSVCVLGENPFGTDLNPMKSRLVNNRNITIKYYSHAFSGLSECNVLFITESERDNIVPVIEALHAAPVLTISDIDSFSTMGGMVEFERKGPKIGIKIDLHSVQKAGISISSKLLRIAEINE